MKSITIHGIDKDLEKRIQEKAKEYGLSQNRTIKSLLQESLLSDPQGRRKEAFADLFGKWTKKERMEFERRIVDLEQTDASDWKK